MMLPAFGPFSCRLGCSYCSTFPKTASNHRQTEVQDSSLQTDPHAESTLHTCGKDSNRNPVARITSRIINEAKQPASWRKRHKGGISMALSGTGCGKSRKYRFQGRRGGIAS